MARGASGGTVSTSEHSANHSSRPPRPALRAKGGEGARVHAHYQDRHEEYVLVTRDDLREIRTFGWMQQVLFGIGMFLFSGAFWLLMELIANEQHFEFTLWMGMCIISMAGGGIIGIVGLVIFTLRQKRLGKYFLDIS